MNILVIGAGNMGLAYAKAIAKSELLSKNPLLILDNSAEITEELKKVKRFEVHTELASCIPKADVIFIAVKPYHSEALMSDLKPYLNEGQLAISIMAGITIQ